MCYNKILDEEEKFILEKKKKKKKKKEDEKKNNKIKTEKRSSTFDDHQWKLQPKQSEHWEGTFQSIVQNTHRRGFCP